MPQPRQTARSSEREAIPLAMRVYGLEGITDTQDSALAQLAVTTARHDERLGAHDVTLATNNEQIRTLVLVTANLTSSVNKLLFAVIGSALGVAASVSIAALAL
jgi:hypothetical protein